jgi:hypothetical protein
MSTWVNRNPFIFLGGLLALWLGVFSISFYASSVGAPAPSYPAPLPPSQHDEHLLALDRAGIEAAYREQVTLLFKNWMNDPSTHQPNRALTGLRNAAKAYVEAMDGANRREEQLRTRQQR